MHHIVYFYLNAYVTVAALTSESLAGKLADNLNFALLESSGKGIYKIIFVS